MPPGTELASLLSSWVQPAVFSWTYTSKTMTQKNPPQHYQIRSKIMWRNEPTRKRAQGQMRWSVCWRPVHSCVPRKLEWLGSRAEHSRELEREHDHRGFCATIPLWKTGQWRKDAELDVKRANRKCWKQGNSPIQMPMFQSQAWGLDPVSFTWKAEAGRGQPGLHSEFWATIGNKARFCLYCT